MITALGTYRVSPTQRVRFFVGTGGTLALTEVYRRVGRGLAWCVVGVELRESRP